MKMIQKILVVNGFFKKDVDDKDAYSKESQDYKKTSVRTVNFEKTHMPHKINFDIKAFDEQSKSTGMKNIRQNITTLQAESTTAPTTMTMLVPKKTQIGKIQNLNSI